MTMHAFELFADYHQFYVWDAGVNPSAPENYTAEDIRRLVKVGPNVVVIQPIRRMTVPVELQIYPDDPGFDPSEWNHIVECHLELPTGALQVHECTGEAVLDLAVAPGGYRVRALFSGLETLSNDGLEGDDRYRVVLWPAPSVPLRTVKQWEGERAG